MQQRKQPPTILYRGQRQDVTPANIARLVAYGLTSSDYEILGLIADYYRFETIGALITDALDRAGVQ